MSLTLAVPNLAARSAGEIELQPHKVKKWLDELPLLNVAETGRKLFTTLSLHNRVEYDHKLRLELLELFRYPVSQLSLELTKQYIGLPLPLLWGTRCRSWRFRPGTRMLFSRWPRTTANG